MTHSPSPGEGHNWQFQGTENLWLPYAQMQTVAGPLPVASTDGMRIKLADGRELVDGVASWWTACHGYNHPHIVEAVEAQLKTMPHVMFGGLVHEPAANLAKRLVPLLPPGLSHVFFADSGSVSVEIALKMALQFWTNQGIEGRNRIVAFRNGYHGDTFATMAVSDPEDGMHSAFRDQVGSQIIVDLPQTKDELSEFDAMLASRRDEIAAIIMEPLVQGAGGMKFHSANTLAVIRILAAKHDILFIADEIFTGFGRTGSLFACDEAQMAPDIICISKALTGGTVSLGATAANERVYQAFLSDDPSKALMHGPTFMANPIGCAAANASLDLFESEERIEAIAEIEAFLKEALEPCRKLDGVVDVRVRGAIGVVQLGRLERLDWLKKRFVEEGVWLRPFGDIIYLTPAFIATEDDLRLLTDAIVTVLTEWSKG